MKIDRVVIRNFRAFAHLDVSLASNISCVIGENNTGKTAFLHALRLCLDVNLSSAFRTLGMRDVSSGIDVSEPTQVLIGVEITDYAGKINEEALVGAWGIAPDRARLIYRFRPRLSVRESMEARSELHRELILGDYHWELVGGGDSRRDLAEIAWNEDVGHSIRFGDLQSFLVVFLPALRDVESDLRQARYSPLLKLIEATKIEAEDKKKIVTALQRANTTISSSDPIKKLARSVDKAFNEVAGPAFEMTIDVGIAEPSFQSVVKSLRLLLSNDALDDADPSSNGLGVNNVLYISILIEYFKKRLEQENSAGQLILFEEPEAHLHPQLQLSLYAALEALPFQTILTTHSTHVTAQAGLNTFVSLTNVGEPFTHSAVPAASEGLTKDDVRDLERYLDATKSALLFARKVILVEGPAELLLIPALVRQVMNIDLDTAGITVIPIYGVHFDVYAKLFSDSGMPKRCAIIADGDLRPSDASECDDDFDTEWSPPNLSKLEGDYVRVFTNASTFERAVAMTGTVEMLASAATKLGATTVSKQLRGQVESLEKLDPNSAEAKALRNAYRDKVLNTAKRYGKARFAQVAARYVHLAQTIPPYIREAVEWLAAE